ncbi:MAG: sugar phosphate nucleotidyltransferase [Thermodesulfobacteriota bacterium]
MDCYWYPDFEDMKSQNLHPRKPESRRPRREVIGLIPAAGKGTRLAPLPFSKELYPIGFQEVNDKGGLRSKVVCHYLLEKMHLAEITKVYIILRQGKWDIPNYFCDGSMLKMHIAYLMMGLPFGAPFTLDQAYAFVQDKLVAFGFPDIIFETNNAFVRMLECQASTNSDIVLGLLDTEKSEEVDMVDVDQDWSVRALYIKPRQTSLKLTWVVAVWTPVFTQFMHNYIDEIRTGRPKLSVVWSENQELTMGHVIQEALVAGLKVKGVFFSEDTCLDIGTINNLMKAVRHFSRKPEGLRDEDR